MGVQRPVEPERASADRYDDVADDAWDVNAADVDLGLGRNGDGGVYHLGFSCRLAPALGYLDSQTISHASRYGASVEIGLIFVTVSPSLHPMIETPETFARVFEKWPSRAALARDLTAVGFTVTDVQVRMWVYRGYAPKAALPALSKAARRARISGVNLKMLRRLPRNP